MQIAIEDLKKGDLFTRKEDSKTEYLRDEYCRESKKYACGDVSDISRFIYLKKGTLVYKL